MIIIVYKISLSLSDNFPFSRTLKTTNNFKIRSTPIKDVFVEDEPNEFFCSTGIQI